MSVNAARLGQSSIKCSGIRLHAPARLVHLDILRGRHLPANAADGCSDTASFSRPASQGCSPTTGSWGSSTPESSPQDPHSLCATSLAGAIKPPRPAVREPRVFVAGLAPLAGLVAGSFPHRARWVHDEAGQAAFWDARRRDRVRDAMVLAQENLCSENAELVPLWARRAAHAWAHRLKPEEAGRECSLSPWPATLTTGGEAWLP